MKKVFLSHASTDKQLVRQVASGLGRHRIEFDEITFTENRSNIEEIRASIERCCVFVLFVSEASLGSEWVEQELKIARKKEAKEPSVFRIVAIIIDSTPYSDPRIPQWLRDEKNLSRKLMPYPIQRVIRMHHAELVSGKASHNDKPYLTRVNELADLTSKVEEDPESVPKCIVISGWPNVGRASFAKHGLRQVEITKSDVDLPTITADSNSSIEDVISRVSGYKSHSINWL